jgi:hypothetical protein
MKFTVTITCESIGEWDWLSQRLRPDSTAHVDLAFGSHGELVAPGRSNGGQRPEPQPEQQAPDTQAQAQADPKPKRGRPAKPAPAPDPKLPEPEQAPAPEPAPTVNALVAANDAARLQFLKDAITTTARAAMNGKGDKKILDLLPAFREATGLDFVMNAREEHIPALVQLAEQAGVPLA